MLPIEKLGAFYLGQEYDIKSAKRLENLIMYDARDLTTHAVCVGMTGSGKTGLCIDLLEEAALDGVPSIMIDPKGDITNLMLTFPDLLPSDFQPWVNVDDARRKGMSVDDYAVYIADSWKKGLADWGQGPERIRALKESVDLNIYTPGSDAGRQVSILASLKAPRINWDDNSELLPEQIQGTVSALLGLVKVDADPLRSREHILLSNIFEHFWSQGQDLDLAKLILSVQNPPVQRLGVLDIDSFFPQKDRFGLAMALNNIIAAPGFAAWVQGEPLDIGSLLFTQEGKPRHTIFYISHLSDAERMFFVTLLLQELVTWVRQQSGTTSLRALLYFDELFGFFPPVANPPSKTPLLTLLKQARAFGLGVVLTTQNPVDVDYKGLSNAGTWFIGKLQTDQDKARVIDGLQSASATAGGAVDRGELERSITSLSSRNFLLHNVHQDRDLIFQTRWAMSYLRGPLTRPQVRELMLTRKGVAPSATLPSGNAAAEQAAPAATPHQLTNTADTAGYHRTPPGLPPDLTQVFLPARVSPSSAVARLEKAEGRRVSVTESRLVYEAQLLAQGRVRFTDRTRRVDESRQLGHLVGGNAVGAIVRWQEATPVVFDSRDLQNQPEENALFGAVPAQLNSGAEIRAAGKDWSDYLYREEVLSLRHLPALNLYAEPGESERDFVARAHQVAREKRDAEVEKMRLKYQTKLDRLEDKLSKEQADLAGDRAQYEARKREELLSAGESVVGMLGIFGRRRSSSVVSKAATKRRLTTKAATDIRQSEAEIKRLEQEIEEMRQEMQTEAEDIGRRWTSVAEKTETYDIRPSRGNVEVELVALAWAPYWEIGYPSAGGQTAYDRVPAWEQSSVAD
jgi:outer membrane murein-binding lipoprotein Lpp